MKNPKGGGTRTWWVPSPFADLGSNNATNGGMQYDIGGKDANMSFPFGPITQPPKKPKTPAKGKKGVVGSL